MSEQNKFAFQKANYVIMIIGVLTLIIGFFIMASDSEPYGFGFMGLTLGPIVVMLGFAIEFVAIMYKPKAVQDTTKK
ncbi:MAG: fumarate reductase subunit C [Marinoscillum sp.]|jgi:fumarate reductase subunit C